MAADAVIQLAPALCAAAARSGSLEVLQMLRARGCPWDAEAIVAGAEGGCEAVLEYLVAQGCCMLVSGRPANASVGLRVRFG